MWQHFKAFYCAAFCVTAFQDISLGGISRYFIGHHFKNFMGQHFKAFYCAAFSVAAFQGISLGKAFHWAAFQGISLSKAFHWAAFEGISLHYLNIQPILSSVHLEVVVIDISVS